MYYQLPSSSTCGCAIVEIVGFKCLNIFARLIIFNDLGSNRTTMPE